MKVNIKKWSRKQVAIAGLAIGLVATLLVVVAVRLANPPHVTHYHANFALFIDGQRDNFDSFAYYEEVQACTSDQDNNPRHRVHMHDQVNNVVHVHAPAATWGHFFENLGYGLTDNAVVTDKGAFVDGAGGKKLTFILNGKEVSTIANTIIKSEDVLLIDYGQNNDTVAEYEQITKNASEYNHRQDPASCAGAYAHGFGERLKNAVQFWQ